MKASRMSSVEWAIAVVFPALFLCIILSRFFSAEFGAVFHGARLPVRFLTAAHPAGQSLRAIGAVPVLYGDLVTGSGSGIVNFKACLGYQALYADTRMNGKQSHSSIWTTKIKLAKIGD